MSVVWPDTVVPLICHTYVGADPPSVGVAVKVTLAPRQIEVWLAATDTVGVTLETVMVIMLLVAVGVLVHVALLVMITLTWSLLTRAVVVNMSVV
jgi:hypothetical protein